MDKDDDPFCTLKPVKNMELKGWGSLLSLILLEQRRISVI